MESWKEKLANLKNQMNDEQIGSDDSTQDSVNSDAGEVDRVWDIEVKTTPLQVLIHADCPHNNNETRSQMLREAVRSDKAISSDVRTRDQTLYSALCDRIDDLASETFTVRFPWQLRVGGIRGFQELLIPAFHPIYGIPYVPASSLKGVLRRWAKKTQKGDEVGKKKFNRLLGCLDKEGDGQVAAVQILDAFPLKPCLNLDIANPQWKWENSQVKYGAVPHPILSLYDCQLKIGLIQTSIGQPDDVKTVKQWLQQALKAEGLGGRVSTGYGRALIGKIKNQNSQNVPSGYNTSEHRFELWSQGVYGFDKDSPEPFLRSTSLRGILRYWFRSIALGIYPVQQCKDLETDLFGAIEPEPNEGSIRLHIKNEAQEHYNFNDTPQPMYYKGRIILESRSDTHLILAKNLLRLAFHLGGLGRGSRRPLHWNNGIRGCYFEFTDALDVIDGTKEAWDYFLAQDLYKSLQAIATPNENNTLSSGNPGMPGKRLQDVLGKQAQIYLVSFPNLKHPNSVKNWSSEGTHTDVRGEALTFFYASGYKGLSGNKEGNKNVGGTFKPPTPSFVWISSNRGLDSKGYQILTLFGSDQKDRKKFIQALETQANKNNRQYIRISLPWQR